MALTAYRAWALNIHGKVRSLWFPVEWHGRTMKATCLYRRKPPPTTMPQRLKKILLMSQGEKPDHPSPAPLLRYKQPQETDEEFEERRKESPSCNSKSGEGCGLYAALTLEKARGWGRNNYGGLFIVGRVSIWGNVLPYDKGYRAQFCRIDAFIYSEEPPKNHAIRKAFNKDYNDPLPPQDRLLAMQIRLEERAAEWYGVPIETAEEQVKEMKGEWYEDVEDW